VGWLDLACGRGQILEGLTDSLSDLERSKIDFCAYDVDQDYARETHRAAALLGFAAVDITVGDLRQFDRLLPENKSYDFITLTNTVHEVAPSALAHLLADAVCRLTERGVLFVYDMERIEPPELGALSWTGPDMRVIVDQLMKGFGVHGYHPGVGRWHHRTVDGWNLQVDRQDVGLSDDALKARRATAVSETGKVIRGLMSRRLEECCQTLKAFTEHGVETAEEQTDKTHLLYEYWALSRALGDAR